MFLPHFYQKIVQFSTNFLDIFEFSGLGEFLPQRRRVENGGNSFGDWNMARIQWMGLIATPLPPIAISSDFLIETRYQPPPNF